MRICDVTQFYSPYGGGVRRYLTEKRRFVQEATDDEHILVVPGETDSFVREGRLSTYTIASPPINTTSRYRALLDQEKLRTVFFQIHPDLIESGDPYQVAWTALAVGRAMRIPVVGFYHSHFPDAYLRTASKFGGPLLHRVLFAWARGYVCRLYNRFDQTLVCAEGLRKVLRSWGVNTVQGVKLGVDTAAFSPGPADLGFRARLGAPPSATLLLFVGRLAGEKNIATLLGAFRHLRRTSRKDYRLLCVGQGPWREELLQTREETNGAVHWIPYVSNSSDLAQIYRSADLAVHPCLNETFGLVPLEAQACGLAVCGVRGSFLDENIPAGLEFWAERNRPEDLARAIERMLGQNLRQIGEDASRIVRKNYAWNVVLDALWTNYRELLASRGADEWGGPERHADHLANSEILAGRPWSERTQGLDSASVEYDPRGCA